MDMNALVDLVALYFRCKGWVGLAWRLTWSASAQSRTDKQPSLANQYSQHIVFDLVDQAITLLEQFDCVAMAQLGMQLSARMMWPIKAFLE